MSQGSEPLRRAAAVMDLVASSAGLTVSQISTALGLPLPSAHRLVNSLTDIGYLSGGGRGSSYRLGPRFYRQYHSSLSPQALDELVSSTIQGLADRLEETVFVAQLKANRIELGAAVFPDRSVRSLIHPGHLFPVHATSAGKVICAHQYEQFVDEALAKPLEAFRPHTKTDKHELLKEYALIREQGYATIDDELDEGVFAVSCPITIYGEVLYSVGTVGIRERMLRRASTASLVEALSGVADRLSALLRATPLARGEGPVDD